MRRLNQHWYGIPPGRPETGSPKPLKPETGSTKPPEPESGSGKSMEPETDSAKPLNPEIGSTKPMEPETGSAKPLNPEIGSTKFHEPGSQKLSDSERALHEQFVHYGQNAKEWLRKCVLLLPQIDRLRIWEKRGFSSIFEYAAKLAGMSREKVREGLRIMRKTENLPELRKVIEKKGIWAVRPVLTLATPKNEKDLAEHAMNMNAATLATFAKELRNREMLKESQLPTQTTKDSTMEDPATKGQATKGTATGPQTTEGREITSPLLPLFTMGDCLTYEEKLELLLVSVDKEVARKLQKIKGQGDWNFVMKLLLQTWERQLELEKPQPVKTKSKHIPNNIRRYIMKRSSCYCEFPGCMKKYAELHHADRFSLVWKHDPNRIFALCSEHHNLAHNGLIENESSDIKLWRVQHIPNITDIKYVIDRAVIIHRNRKRPKKNYPPECQP